MKKIFRFLPFLLLSCFLLTGCGDSKDELVSELMYGVKPGMSMKEVSDYFDKKGYEVNYEADSPNQLTVDNTFFDYCGNYQSTGIWILFGNGGVCNVGIYTSKENTVEIKAKLNDEFGEPVADDGSVSSWLYDDYLINVGDFDSNDYGVLIMLKKEQDETLNSDSESTSEIITNALLFSKEADVKSTKLYFDTSGDEIVSVMVINYYDADHISEYPMNKTRNIANNTSGVDYYIQEGSSVYTETIVLDVENNLSDIAETDLLPFDIDDDKCLSLTKIKRTLLKDGWKIIE